MTTRAVSGSKKFRGTFDFGGAMAELDPLLATAFVDNGDYAAVASQVNPLCFLIGRTGVGKSAVLSQLERDHPERTIRITPENLLLPYITNLNVVKVLRELDVHLEPFLRALWKHVIVVEVLRHK